MKDMGAFRPTCEECGLVELSQVEAQLFNTVLSYLPMLADTDGSGGWSIKPEGVKFVAEEMGVEDRLFFVEVVIIIIGEAFQPTGSKIKSEDEP